MTLVVFQGEVALMGFPQVRPMAPLFVPGSAFWTEQQDQEKLGIEMIFWTIECDQ